MNTRCVCARAAEDCNWCDSRIKRVVKENFYVDDLLRGCDSVEDAKRELEDVRKVCEEGGFKLHKFVSNETEVLAIDSDKDVSNALGVT